MTPSVMIEAEITEGPPDDGLWRTFKATGRLRASIDGNTVDAITFNSAVVAAGLAGADVTQSLIPADRTLIRSGERWSRLVTHDPQDRPLMGGDHCRIEVAS
jgi:hypothetical protein